MTRGLSDADIQREIAALDALAHWMDAKFRLPGTDFRFGLDALVGFVPGMGDVATVGPSLYLLWRAQRLGAPRGVMLRMLAHVAVDAAFGAVPLLGDLFDAAFKANQRNVALLKAALTRGGADAP